MIDFIFLLSLFGAFYSVGYFHGRSKGMSKARGLFESTDIGFVDSSSKRIKILAGATLREKPHRGIFTEAE